jgi:hypothetical protein
MTKTSKSNNEPVRVVLEGVPYIGWDSNSNIGYYHITPFPFVLWSCMKFLGENYSREYIMGASGAAFRLLWKPGWNINNVDLRNMGKDGKEAFRRAFEAVGYKCNFVGREQGCDNEACFRTRIIESIRDKGLPVIAFGVLEPRDIAPCIITGYDESGDVLIGWHYDQKHSHNEFEPSGYFRKRDWFTITDELIIIGDKEEKPSLSEIYRKTLIWALQLVRTPMIHDRNGAVRHNGLAAYTAWAEDLLRDEDFSSDDMSVTFWRMMSHSDNVDTVAERRCAAMFLKQMAKDESAMAEELLAAVACYEAEYELISQCWLVDNVRAEAEARKLAEPAVRRQSASLILQARDQDAKAVEHIERALAMGGKRTESTE